MKSTIDYTIRKRGSKKRKITKCAKCGLYGVQRDYVREGSRAWFHMIDTSYGIPTITAHCYMVGVSNES